MTKEEKEKRKQEILAGILAEEAKNENDKKPFFSGNKSAMKELGPEDWAEAAQDELEDFIEQQGIYLRQ